MNSDNENNFTYIDTENIRTIINKDNNEVEIYFKKQKNLNISLTKRHILEIFRVKSLVDFGWNEVIMNPIQANICMDMILVRNICIDTEDIICIKSEDFDKIVESIINED